MLQRAAQRAFGFFPDFVAANILLFLLRVAEREANPVVIQTIGVEDLQREVHGAVKLLLNLVMPQEYMRVILREAAHTRQARQYSRLLITIERGKLGIANGQL